MKKMAAFVPCLFLSLGAFANTIVSDEDDYDIAIEESCEGKAVGAQCTVEFEGGEVAFGVCIYLDPDSPADGTLSCKINLPEISGCKNNALGTPGSAVTFGGLLGLLSMLRRRKKQ